MHIRTFRAGSLQEALELIRNQMGPDASVLHTRQVRDGWMGWLGRTYVEVTAGAEDTRVAETTHLSDAGEPSSDRHVAGPEVLGFADHSSDQSHVVRRSDDADIGTVAAESPVVASERLGHERRPSQPGYPPLPMPLWQYRDGLLDLGVPASVADRWLSATASFAAATSFGSSIDAGSTDFGPTHFGLHHHDEATPWLSHLRRSVMRELRIGSPIRTQPGDRRVVALVGPTGVGKTTTIAKLAAGFRIEARRRVGLLTIDTFRIAAVQQLKAYAEIMDLPMEVVETPDQMQPAMDRLGDVDLILIDTAGRSPRSDARIEQLVGLLHAAQPDETHLVLSATASRGAIEATFDGFAPVVPTATILTKVDETTHLAPALAALVATPSGRGGLPIAYVTHGQQVPDDIAVADVTALADRLVPSSWNRNAMTADGLEAA